MTSPRETAPLGAIAELLVDTADPALRVRLVVELTVQSGLASAAAFCRRSPAGGWLRIQSSGEAEDLPSLDQVEACARGELPRVLPGGRLVWIHGALALALGGACQDDVALDGIAGLLAVMAAVTDVDGADGLDELAPLQPALPPIDLSRARELLGSMGPTPPTGPSAFDLLASACADLAPRSRRAGATLELDLSPSTERIGLAPDSTALETLLVDLLRAFHGEGRYGRARVSARPAEGAKPGLVAVFERDGDTPTPHETDRFVILGSELESRWGGRLRIGGKKAPWGARTRLEVWIPARVSQV